MAIQQTGECIQCGGACQEICPAKVFEFVMRPGGYGQYHPEHSEDCIGCGACVEECAAGVLTMEEN